MFVLLAAVLFVFLNWGVPVVVGFSPIFYLHKSCSHGINIFCVSIQGLYPAREGLEVSHHPDSFELCSRNDKVMLV